MSGDRPPWYSTAPALTHLLALGGFLLRPQLLSLTGLSSCCELQPTMTPKSWTHNIRMSAIGW